MGGRDRLGVTVGWGSPSLACQRRAATFADRSPGSVLIDDVTSESSEDRLAISGARCIPQTGT
jgi:hypothetical protein